MFDSAQCQECGALFARTGGSLIFCSDCLERLDAEAEATCEGHPWSPEEFSAACQDWERNR